VGGGGGARALRSREAVAQAKSAAASSIVDEVIALKKTVLALGTQQHETARFNAEADAVEQAAVKYGLRETVFLGLFNFGVGLSLFLAMFIGFHMTQTSWIDIEPGNVVTAFFATLVGGIAFAELIPAKSSIEAGREAARTCFDAIDAAMVIDNLSEEGERPGSFRGDIAFRGVEFAYPTRPTDAIGSSSAKRVSRSPSVSSRKNR